jgi:hypothetical protein
MSGVNGKVIMSGYGDDNPDDEISPPLIEATIKQFILPD